MKIRGQIQHLISLLAHCTAGKFPQSWTSATQQLLFSPWALFFASCSVQLFQEAQQRGRQRCTYWFVQIMGSFIQSWVAFTILTRGVSQEHGHWLNENWFLWATCGRSGPFLCRMKFLSCQRPQSNKGGNWRQVLILSKFHSILSSPSLNYKHHKARKVQLLSWKALSFLIQVALFTCLAEPI